MEDLTDREREVLTSIIETWEDADLPLAGMYSYRDVVDMLYKLGIPVTPRLKSIYYFGKGDKR